MSIENEVRVVRWPHSSPPSEEIIKYLLDKENLSHYAWWNEPLDTYEAHSHSHHKVIYVVKGSITFILPSDGSVIKLQPGDRLDLPAGVIHAAEVGAKGVTCIEANIPA